MKRVLSLLLSLLLLAAMLGGCMESEVTLQKPTRKTVTQTLGDGAPSATEYVYTYDSRGELLLEEDSHGGRIEYIYENGRLVREVKKSQTADPDSVTEYIYNGAGRLIEKRLPHGITCCYTYGGDGEVSREEYFREGSDTPLETREYTYGEGGRLLSSVTAAYGDTDTWEYRYGENGRREGATRTYRSAFGGVTVAEVTYTYSEDTGLLSREEYRTVSQEGEMVLLSETRVTEYFDYKSFTVTK